MDIGSTNTSNCAHALALTERCRKLLLKINEDYVSQVDPIPEIDNLPTLIKNSLPSRSDKREAKALFDELLEYDKLVLYFYDKADPELTLQETFDNV